MNVRNQILNMAQDLIQRNGIDSFSFRVLANEVKIKSASVHYHFPKKEDLIVEIAKNYNTDFSHALASIKKSKKSSKKKFLSLLELFNETKKNNKICLCAMLASTNGKIDKASNEELDSFFINISNWSLDILQEAKTNDELKAQMPIKSLANLLVASLEGALLLDRVSPKYEYLKSCADFINSILK